MNSVQLDIFRMNSSKSPTMIKNQSNLSNPHQQDFRRTMNSSKMQSSVPPSTEQLRKVIRSLEVIIQQEKEKRKQVQSNLVAYRERALYKENQFKKILQRMGYLETSGNSPEVDQIYKSILTNFDQSNQQALMLLEKKYQQNCNFMDRRCTQIMKKTQQQLKNVKKLSEQDFQKIQRQIEDVLFLAKYLQQQNSTFKKKMSTLQFRNKILYEQRAFILQDLSMTKKKVVKLTRQLHKQDSKSMNKSQVGSEYSISRNQIHTSNFQRNSRKISKMQIDELIDHQKAGIFSNNSVNVRMNEPKLSLQDTTIPNTIKTISLRPSDERISMTRGSKRVIEPKNPIFTSDFTDKISVTSSLGKKNTQQMAMTSLFFNQTLLKSNKKDVHKNPRNQKQYKKSSSICINKQPSQTIAYQTSINTNQQTIKHLKICLQRERKRRLQLGNIVTKLKDQNQEINDTIQECLRNSSKGKNGQVSVESLIKSEKLFQVIRDIKKRLAMIQHPSVNCGWGDQDLIVLAQLEKQINPEQDSGQNSSQGIRESYIKQILGQ